MRHPREELAFRLVRAARFLCRAHPVLFAALFLAEQAHRKEHALRLAIFITRLHDKAGEVPVAVLNGILDRHGILGFQALSECREVEKAFHVGQVLLQHAPPALLVHAVLRKAAATGQTVHPAVAGDLLVALCAQVDAVNGVVDLADGRDDLVVCAALRKRRLEFALMLALLAHDLVDIVEIHQHLKARVRLQQLAHAHLKVDLAARVRRAAVAAADPVFVLQRAHQDLRLQCLQKVGCRFLDDKALVIIPYRLIIREDLVPIGQELVRCVGIVLHLHDLRAILHQIDAVYRNAVPTQDHQHLLLQQLRLQVLLKRFLLLLQKREHPQLFPRAADVSADKAEQVDLRRRDLAPRIAHTEKAAQRAAVKDRHRDLAADVLRLQNVILRRHHAAHLFKVRDVNGLAALKGLQPDGHIRPREPFQIFDLRRNALRAPLEGIGVVFLPLLLEPVKKKDAVRVHRLADQTQQTVDRRLDLFFAVHSVDLHELAKQLAGIVLGRFFVICRVILHRHAASLLCSANFVHWGKLSNYNCDIVPRSPAGVNTVLPQSRPAKARKNGFAPAAAVWYDGK